jgi:GAF domain-containing protein
MIPDLDPKEFVRLAEALRAAPTPSRTAEQIVAYVREQLYADHAGITLIRGRQLETVASTDGLVAWADVLQSELDEGPCQDTSWQRQTLLVGDLAADRRWPQWAAKVTALGITSVLAAELSGNGGQRLGSINVYWTHHRTFTDDDIAFVNIFARHAALALMQSWNETGLNTALDTRKLIGQAQGLLMERHGLDEARSFEVLRRYSQDRNVKLRAIAAHLIATRHLPTSDEVANGAEDTVAPGLRYGRSRQSASC